MRWSTLEIVTSPYFSEK